MHRQDSVGTRGIFVAIYLACAGTLAACSSSGDAGAPTGGSKDSGGGSSGGDSSVGTGSGDSSAAMDTGESGVPSDGARADAMTRGDGGDGSNPGDAAPDARAGDGGIASDGAGIPTDAGGADADAGVRDVGSCCSAQTTPGCDDPNLELCVCNLEPSCCTTAWSLACTLLVEQKYCQPGVRDCMGCTSTGIDAGGWDPACCTDWTSACDSVAVAHCNAVGLCL